jgi:glycosyltransferase involved in cell wall biosynthesis
MVTPDEQTPHAAASENQRPDVRPIVVTVATYRRPRLLADLLRSLESMSSKRTFRVVVVDNDADASAREVALSSALEVTYVVESAPGIAEARNRGLDEVTSADSAVVFVDDDERVAVDWLDRLVDGWREQGTEVVTGPVVSVFASDCPRWIVDGGFIQRPRHRTGTRISTAATNNTLLSVAAWESAGRPRFDPSFSETGVATQRSSRCWSAGARIAWIDEALVEEDVPADRATFRWIWRRAVRGGNVQARVQSLGTRRGAMAARVAASLPYRAVRLVLGLVWYRRLRAEDLIPLAWQCGLVGGLSGRLIKEYKRS